MVNLLTSAFNYAERNKSYYSQWTFDQCYAVSASTDSGFEKLHQILYRLIKHYIVNYKSYIASYQLTPRRQHVLDLFQDSPCDVGTYRTDFVISQNGQPKLIEINNRFPLNGIFEPSFYFSYVNQCSNISPSSADSRAKFNRIYREIERIASCYSKLVVLQGKDLNNSSRFYGELLEASGFKVEFCNIHSTPEYITKLDDAWIISELTLPEIEQIPDNILLHLSQKNILNDFKSVLLLHDKSFFSLINSPHLQASCLSETERSYLNMFLVRSFSPSNLPSKVLDNALKYKDSWILKSRSLGKSSEIYAGVNCSNEQWESMLSLGNVNEYVLQEYVSQPKFQGMVKGRPCDDYATGTILMMNGIYGGLGHFRTSDASVLGAGQEIRQLPVSIFPDDEVMRLDTADFIRDKIVIGAS